MNIVKILNTVAAASADLIVGIGTVKIGPADAPVIIYKDITKASKNVLGVANFQRSVMEQSDKINITITTATVGTVNKISVTQLVGENTVTSYFANTAVTGDTTTTVAAALVAATNGSNVHFVATNATNVISLVAMAVSEGNSALLNVAIISGGATQVPTPNAALVDPTLSAIGTTGIVTSVAHGLPTGTTLVLNGVAGAGAANVNGVVFTTRWLTANTFQLVEGSGVGVITVVGVTGYLPGRNPFGQYAEVLASITAADGTTLPVSGFQYAKLTLAFGGQSTPLNTIVRQDEEVYELWITEAVTTATAIQIANYTTLETRVAQLLLCQNGSGNVDANLLAIPV